MVIDNNSNDGIKDVVSHYSNVYFVRNSVNNGFVGGHNQVLNYTSTEYGLVLNPDMILDKHIIDSTEINIKKNRRAIYRGSGVDNGQYDSSIKYFWRFWDSCDL
ncbi:glycosyltransferase [Lysinibacillus xylanilyticus]|uniref:glycosyltransferase n=1 Tax=Lysinibacillus xylanilyticus TaxID=582475 RepID=UPI0038090984